MISFAVSKDQDAAVLTIDGCAVRLRTRRGNLCCPGCELFKRQDNSGISACEALTRQSGALRVTFCMPTERSDGSTVIWEEAP